MLERTRALCHNGSRLYETRIVVKVPQGSAKANAPVAATQPPPMAENASPQGMPGLSPYSVKGGLRLDDTLQVFQPKTRRAPPTHRVDWRRNPLRPDPVSATACEGSKNAISLPCIRLSI